MLRVISAPRTRKGRDMRTDRRLQALILSVLRCWSSHRQLSPPLLKSVNKLPIISHFSCALAVFYFSVKLGRTHRSPWRHFNPRKKRKEEESDWQTSIIRLRNWAHVRRKAGKTNTKRKGIILGEGKRGSIDSLRAVFKGKLRCYWYFLPYY